MLIDNADGSALGAGAAGSSSPMTSGNVVALDETGARNPAGLDPAQVKQLLAGGPSAGMKWLYPYDGTVFPRGVRAPLLMWQGNVPDAVYLRIQSSAFLYRGVLPPPAASGLHVPNGLSGIVAQYQKMPAQPQLQVPQDVWERAGEQSLGRADSFEIAVSALSNGSAYGPITLHVQIAQGTLKGSVYYNSYVSEVGSATPPTGNLPDVSMAGGKVLKISSTGQVELVVSGPCNGCHSVSANGSRLIVQSSPEKKVGTGQGMSYGIAANGLLDASPKAIGPRASFGALYPDGSRYLSTALVPLVLDVGSGSYWQTSDATADATLYDATTGAVIPDTGVPTGALMPMFSPDGRRLVFNDAALNAASLAVMDYDTTTNKASNYTTLLRTSNATTSSARPAFPLFLPDDKAVVFAMTASNDFTAGYLGGSVAVGTAAAGAALNGVQFPSDLYIADLATKQYTPLAKAMGFNVAGDPDAASYLPFGADDLHHNYLPTGLPVAAGGYFWVFFDSLRHFGNLGLQRQLWVAAIDIRPDGNYTVDRSHPAFYLPGQEYGAGNHRAFAALDPCQRDGAACTTGIDCCSGFCPLDSTGGRCSPPQQNRCADVDERCASAQDCCPEQHRDEVVSCIAGFCAVVPLL
jgi:hypothetical protein